MEGNLSLSKCLILVIPSPQFHIPVDWIPAIPAGMTGLQHLCITMRSGAWESTQILVSPFLFLSNSTGLFAHQKNFVL